MILPIMKNNIYLLVFGLCLLYKVEAQIVAGEYFWDVDPGIGLATALSSAEIASGSQNESFALNIQTPVAAGQHILFVRFKQNDTLWSQAYPQTLFIGPENLLSGAVDRTDTLEAVTIEHYWNSNTANAITTNLPASDNDFKLTVGLPSTGAVAGSNILNYRIKDKFGLWTAWASDQILIMGEMPLASLDSIKFAIKPSQYSLTGGQLHVNFEDQEDKVNLTSKSIPNDTSIVLGQRDISTKGLAPGLHILSFRAYANDPVTNDISASDSSALYQMAVMVDNTIQMSIDEPHMANGLPSTEFCPGGTLKIPIATTGNWPRNHPGIKSSFNVKLSNSSGQNFETIVSQMNNLGDTLVAIIPANHAVGSGFRVMVESTNPMIRDTASSILTIGLSLEASATNPVICEAGTLNLTVSSNVPASYSWSGPLDFSASGVSPSRSGMSVNGGGVYSVSSVSSLAGCTASATVSITVNPLPIIVLGTNSPICEGQTLDLISSSAGNSFQNWSKGNTTLGGIEGNKSILNVSLADSGYYKVTYNSPGNCQKMDSIKVNVKPLPVLSGIGSNSPICSGNTLTFGLNSTVGSTYSWTGPNNFSSNTEDQSITNAQTNTSGTYSVAVTLSGCVINTTVITVVNLTPSSAVSSPVAICEASQLKLNIVNTPSATYSWSGPLDFNSTDEDPLVATSAGINRGGVYSVTVSLGSCTASNTVQVAINSRPQLLTTNQSASAGQMVNLTLAGVTAGSNLPSGTVLSYFTDPAGVNVVADPTNITSSGIYYIKATAPGSCIDMKPVTVSICGGVYDPITDPINSGMVTNVSNQKIKAQNLISGSGTKVTYRSALFVELLPGFKAEAQTVFLSEIGNCQ